MSTINGTIEYTCEKGTLWRDGEGYHWTSSKDGSDSYIMERIIKLKPMLTKFRLAVYNNSVTLLNVIDTKLIGCKDTGSWEEVDHCQILNKECSYQLYTGKNNGLAILIDMDNYALDVIALLSDIARYGLNEVYEYMGQFRYLTWLEGQANWQGEPLSKNQELKLKLIDCLDKPPYKNYKAARLVIDDLVIDVYNDESEGYITPLRCDDRHKFYKEA